MRGYFGIGIYQPKTTENIGTLWRSAYTMGAAFCFTIGQRCKSQASDTTRTWQHIPMFQYPDFDTFTKSRPRDCAVIGVEQSCLSRSVSTFDHPHRAIYLLGSEDNGLPRFVQTYCQAIIHIDTRTGMCLNVAVAGSIILYDRCRTVSVDDLINSRGLINPDDHTFDHQTSTKGSST